jgi:phosphatidylserine synthase
MFGDRAIRKFIGFSLGISAISFLIAWLLSLSYKQYNFTGVYLLIPAIMLITIIVHVLLVEASKKSPIKFINKFLASSGIKLFLYFIIILAYIYFIKRDIVLFLCAFLSLYLVFTILEISAILNYLKKN